MSTVVPDQSALDRARQPITFTSTADGSSQPAWLLIPPTRQPGARPLVVTLHTWSFDLQQRHLDCEGEAWRRGWLYLMPDFRGPNRRPEAGGSDLARQDILDAVAAVQARWPVDPRRIYLQGMSGGGHMALLTAGRHPGPWAAVSAWVAVTDLTDWWHRHQGREYARDVAACCGGEPGASTAVEAQYRERSPLTWLAGAAQTPVQVAAGIWDGHTGSVPVDHTLRAFNVLAEAVGGVPVTAAERHQLATPQGRLRDPQPADRLPDPALGRTVYLRRYAGAHQVTIFEGGHEQVARAAYEFLARHRRASQTFAQR